MATGEDISEEDRHPWRSNSLMALRAPLLRVWDRYSGSQPDKETNQMVSRLPRQRLDTKEARKQYLTIHADHAIWEPTPFISFTTSARAVQEIVNLRSTKRDAQTIIAINPAVRAAIGLPIIDMGVEMRCYGIPDPYHRNHEYYKDHYLCLWEVTAPEVIGCWEWHELVRNSHWYEEIVIPKTEEHGRRYSGGRDGDGAFRMSSLWNALADTYNGGYSDLGTPFHTDGETSSEDLGLEKESDYYYSDTDDDIEENNA
ncbi:hypothetical protein MGYG_08176 [Nannizzia gypsea CBS 118893]|uniref:Uncharacterized protein n=1 Tax=Arthroderma gypseum (strain ATCC MYA-4604 / CBS 118893) TaxID=535722 RepID=E4V589_ARTGP|nr:hypothetical protein MGYG_08176 [Nannizzia gypsea CBS 118893]EFR05163.1 hypothetical protein MGYG_08176 [Nannizzia gypsea CBS 118893]